jgi:hypothetical protein
MHQQSTEVLRFRQRAAQVGSFSTMVSSSVQISSQLNISHKAAGVVIYIFSSC